LYCFDPQTTAFGLCPTLFFAAIGTAVFVVGVSWQLSNPFSWQTDGTDHSRRLGWDDWA